MIKHILVFLLLTTGFLVLCVFSINLAFYLSTKSLIYNNLSNAPKVEVVIIPGAAIFENGALSSIFIDRIEIAINLYEMQKVSKILVSGDNSTENHNEVNPVRLYLIERGVQDKDIFLDHAGFDTYSTMYRARHIFGVSSVIISTQSFHLPRAVYLARKIGLQAYGVNADFGHILFRNNLREVIADEKAVLDLTMKRKPKYLGETIPISGDGRNYP